MTIKELEAQYKEQADRRKGAIRKEPSKAKRFWKWVWYGITFPWIWLFYNARDWRSIVCIVISFALWSASVWIWYVLALVSGWESAFAKWCLGIGSAVWIWWLSPVGSPFILLVTITAIGMKTLFNLIKRRKKCERGCYNCKHEYMNCINDNICSSCRLQDSGIELTNTRHGCSRWERKKDEN